MKKSKKKLNAGEFSKILGEEQKGQWVEMKMLGLKMGCFMCRESL